MLVLTRKLGEAIHVGDDVVITVVRIQKDKIRLGIDAPRHVAVHRKEVADRDRAAGAPSSAAPDVGRPD